MLYWYYFLMKQKKHLGRANTIAILYITESVIMQVSYVSFRDI